MESSSLRVRIHVLGATALAAFIAMTLLSYLQAPALWQGEQGRRAAAFFAALGSQSAAVTLDPSTWLAAARLLGGSAAVVVSYAIPLAVASTVVLLLVRLLTRHDRLLDQGMARLLFRWSVAFAAVCLFAFPVFTQDVWLSMAWGRMIAGGINPYYLPFTPASLDGLPLDHFPMVMSYGPLWGIVSGVVMAIARDSVLVAAVLFKAVLAAAWIGSLVLVHKITEGETPRDRCLALATFGWTPLSAHLALSEGHNDIVMVSFALLWFFLLLRGRWTAPVALAASVLCKYATAPLFLIDAIHAVRLRKVSWRDYAIRLAPPGLLALAVFAVFYRSPQFFDGLGVVGAWRFLQPRDAVFAIEDLFDGSLNSIEFAAMAFFPALAMYWAAVAYRNPSVEHIKMAAIALIAAVSFAAVGHLWPWYLIWVLALAALQPAWWLSRLMIGMAVLAPFTVAFWWIEPLVRHQEAAALALYAGAAGWMLLTRPRRKGRAPRLR